jgi:hypothetical protein
MNRSRLASISLCCSILVLLLSACATSAPEVPTVTPTPPSSDLIDPMAGTEHDSGYGWHSMNVVSGVSGNGELLLNGYTSFVGSQTRSHDKDAVMIVGIAEATIDGVDFEEGDIVIFVDDNTPELAPPGTEIIVNKDINILGTDYEPGIYVVNDDGELEPAEE